MNTSSKASTLRTFQILAILILIFADGSNVGQFSLSTLDTWTTGGLISVLLHALAGFILMGFAIQLFYSPQSLAPRIWVSIICALGVIGNIAFIIVGGMSNNNGVGVESAGDWMVVIFIMIGVLLWFATLLMERTSSSRGQHKAAA